MLSSTEGGPIDRDINFDPNEGKLTQEKAWYAWSPEGNPERTISIYPAHKGLSGRAYVREDSPWSGQPGEFPGRVGDRKGTRWEVSVGVNDGRDSEVYKVSVYEDDQDHRVTVMLPNDVFTDEKERTKIKEVITKEFPQWKEKVV